VTWSYLLRDKTSRAAALSMDCMQSAQLVGWETDECRIAKVKSLQNQRHHHRQHHLPGNTLTYTADLAECGKAVRHGLRNMRLHGGVRVEVDSQVAYGRGGRYEISANSNRVRGNLILTSTRRTPKDPRLCVERKPITPHPQRNFVRARGHLLTKFQTG